MGVQKRSPERLLVYMRSQGCRICTYRSRTRTRRRPSLYRHVNMCAGIYNVHGRNLVVECRVFASRYAIRANVQQCARLKKRRTTPSDRATCRQAGRVRDVRHDLCNAP